MLHPHRVLLYLLLMVVSVSQCQLTFFPGNDEASSGPAECTTPRRARGQCISLLECPALLRLLRRPVPKRVKTLLRKSVCDFTGRIPDVCCPLPRAKKPALA